ncbi:MAG: class I SAM-dependent methyltransferase [Patescibacteria group bacterium]
MPVNINSFSNNEIYQRKQYQKRGIGRWYWNYRDRQILSFIKNKQSIIDLGCGEGITLEKLIKKFPDKDIRGIDYCRENIEICKKHRLPVEHGSVYDLKIKDNSINCIVFLEVIEHLDDPQRALSEIYRVLKKNGLLLLIFPNDKIFRIARILIFKFKEAFYDPGHTKQWTPKKIKKVLKKLDFKIIKINNMPFFFWSLSLHCLVVVRK